MDQPQNQPQQQSQLKPTGPKKIKSFWPIVIIVLASAIVGGAVVWTAFNYSLQDQLDSYSFNDHFTKVDHTTPVSDWKTYSNSQYAFEFQYPPDWKQADDPPGAIEITVTNGASYNDVGEYFDKVSFFQATIFPDEDLTLQEWFQKRNYDPQESSEPVDLTVANLPAIKIESQNSAGENEVYFLKTGNHILQIQFPFNQSNFDETYKKILSTFKFTYNPLETMGLKTYTNSQYGFSFQYPNKYCLGSSQNFQFDFNALFVIEAQECPFDHSKVQSNGGNYLVFYFPQALHGQTIDSYLHKLDPKANYKKTVLTYPNVMVYQIENIPGTDDTMIDSGPATDYYLINKDTDEIFLVSPSLNGGRAGDPEMLKDIFSSFKFTANTPGKAE